MNLVVNEENVAEGLHQVFCPLVGEFNKQASSFKNCQNGECRLVYDWPNLAKKVIMLVGINVY